MKYRTKHYAFKVRIASVLEKQKISNLKIYKHMAIWKLSKNIFQLSLTDKKTIEEDYWRRLKMIRMKFRAFRSFSRYFYTGDFLITT